MVGGYAIAGEGSSVTILRQLKQGGFQHGTFEVTVIMSKGQTLPRFSYQRQEGRRHLAHARGACPSSSDLQEVNPDVEDFIQPTFS